MPKPEFIGVDLQNLQKQDLDMANNIMRLMMEDSGPSPSQDTQRQYHSHFPLKLPVGCVEHDIFLQGKWMLFYPASVIDYEWRQAKDLFDRGELRGVSGLSVSTSMPNRRSSDSNVGVIIMFCGPSTNGALMRRIGRNIKEKTWYTHKDGYMYYKSKYQTMRGTRATGQSPNHLYKISVDRH